MTTPAPTGLSRPELAQRLRAVDPAALLVRPRLLRRVIKRDRSIPGLGLVVPHGHCHVLTRARLLELATPAELGVHAEELGAVVILLPRPVGLDLRPAKVERTLLRLSRLLLHATLHRTFQERRAAGAISDDHLRERIAELGPAGWEEIRTVLEQERLLLPPVSDASVYEEFLATFLELYDHAPHMLPRWFPALDNLAAVRERLLADLGTSDLGTRTLLAGAPDPASIDADAPQEAEVPARPLAAGQSRDRLLVQARAGAMRGNLVRSAILRVRAGDPEAARATIGELARRLGAALNLSEEEVARWNSQLSALLEQAAVGAWSRAARLLYDLQTVCVDREKPVFAVDLVEWLVRLGGPLRRELPHQGEVLSCKHLRRALDRVAGVPLPEGNRAALHDLLASALHSAEDAVRDAFRPRLVQVLETAGFKPASHVEALAQGKVVSELLGHIVERGHLNLGDLRDAIARNRLKLGDLAGPGELLTGDALLRANAALAVQLDGVYHRGEFYLRWLQTVSSLAFGTALGRVLTLWLLLPFLAAFLLLMFAEEMAHLVTKHVHLLHTESLLALFFFMQLIIHSADVRWSLGRLLWWLAQGLHFLFVGLPRALLRLPPVQWVLQSRLYLLCLQVLFKPLVVALVVGSLAWLCGATGWLLLGLFLGTFVVALVVNLTPLAARLEELAGDGLVRTWTMFREDLLVGLVAFFLALFRRVLEEVDRLFYTVDEWLRYREGEGRGSLLLKALLGTIWWAITYVFRFVFIVLLEPQVNPIKHFPVVTVGHKVLLLALEPTARTVSTWLDIPFASAFGMVGLVFTLIPGVFGFLAWELKENWRLYKANQSPTLDPVRVGAHGETVRGLLRPGFHSGTIPKLFARLRHLPERAETPRLHRAREGLHHAAEAVEQFLRRDLIDALHGTKIWRDRVRLRVGHAKLDTRRIRVPLLAEGLGEVGPLVLVFEQCGPWLLFRVEGHGWADRLPELLWTLWRDALLGFLKHAGVQVTPDQLATALPRGTTWHLGEDGLEVRGDVAPPAVYDLSATVLEPQDVTGVAHTRWPALTPDAVRLDAHPVPWAAWVDVWQQAQKGHKPPVLLPDVPLPGVAGWER